MQLPDSWEDGDVVHLYFLQDLALQGLITPINHRLVFLPLSRMQAPDYFPQG